MRFKTKQEQYEWWTETIKKIQCNKKSIRAGCREHGVQFWQYYDWKERVEKFIDQGTVILPAKQSTHSPKGRQCRAVSFIEVTDTVGASESKLCLYFKDSWRLEIPEGCDSSALIPILKSLNSI